MRLTLAGLIATLAVSSLAAQFPPAQLKNIKAFPADTKVSALIDSMKAFTRALGVRCTYCHVGREDQDISQYDFVSDDRTPKEKARTMIRMVAAINSQYLAALPSRSSPAVTVTCMTCHRGVAQPRTIQQLVLSAYQAGGVTAADSIYRALRLRYYGAAAYDFGEVPLADVAAAVQAQGKGADAIRLYLLNIEMLPASGFAYRQLGFGYLGMSDTTSALAAFRKRLELQPNNPEAKQLVDMLTKKPAR